MPTNQNLTLISHSFPLLSYQDLGATHLDEYAHVHELQFHVPNFLVMMMLSYSLFLMFLLNIHLQVYLMNLLYVISYLRLHMNPEVVDGQKNLHLVMTTKVEVI